MKVAFTHNLRLTDSEQEAEFDTAETVDAIAAAIEAAGHEVDKIEVSGPASNLLERLESADPDIIFNTAEGSGGRMREAFYPALFDELGIAYTGSDAYTMALTLDKWLTKLVVSRHGVDTPRAALITPRTLDDVIERGVGLAFPVIVKPNYEGSSKGIADDSVVQQPKELLPILKAALRTYPDGVLVEEYIDGIDVAVGYIDGIGHDGGLLAPVEHLVEQNGERPFNIYDYYLKNVEPGRVQFRCPAHIPRDVAARLRSVSLEVIKALGIRDWGRLDYRIAADGRFYLLEANALPSLNQSSSICVATSQLGLTHSATVAAVLNVAALRCNVATATELGLRGRQRRRGTPIRVGFTYNVKREGGDIDNDKQAEWDPPETIIAIANALARQGHIVVHLEATPDLPRVLAEADVDLIFNIAEGVEGRNREAQVPALCELLGIPYTGSDSATLAVALDKALCKKVLMQHGILTPKFQVMETGRERLLSDLSFPLIIKPNAEGSSKGIANANVVDNEEELRTAVRSILDRYRQPVIIEEYISGREFTVGLLGEKRTRVLPPMEIRFKNDEVIRPVYDFVVKQEWEQHVYYECPAKLTPGELKNIEKVVRDTFWALDCRDVARIDLRMDGEGRIYVLEVNPLPGLTPNYSDLVLISQAAGLDYDQLMAEIMVGGLRRLREKRRRDEQALEERYVNGNSNGASKSNGASAARRPRPDAPRTLRKDNERSDAPDRADAAEAKSNGGARKAEASEGKRGEKSAGASVRSSGRPRDAAEASRGNGGNGSNGSAVTGDEPAEPALLDAEKVDKQDKADKDRDRDKAARKMVRLTARRGEAEPPKRRNHNGNSNGNSNGNGNGNGAVTHIAVIPTTH